MTRIRTSGVSGSSENSIIFIPAGGHSHDGVTSSLISTEKYSIYDFSPSFVNSTQSQTRAVRQENNRLAFESLVVNIVNQSVLVPAGIRLTPGTLNASAIMANTITAVHLAANTITADEIAANTITADELVSNIILVNNIIRSNSFQSGVGGNGWQIEYDGTAEFNDVIVRGNIYSNVGTIGGWTLASDAIYVGTKTASGSYTASTGHMTIGSDGHISANKFRVDSDGTLFATGANIAGTITSTAGTIGGWTINSNSISKTSIGGDSILSSVGNYLSVWGQYEAATQNAFVSPGRITVSRDDGKVTVIAANRIDTTDVYATNFYGTATTATTATNQSGGTVNATSVDSSGNITANSADFRRLGGTISTRTGVAAWWGSSSDGGFLGKNASSSLRYKTDVTEVINPLLDPKKLLDVNIVQYKYKDGVLEEDDPNQGKYTIGFIAEDMYEKYQVGATIDEEGRPEAWNYNTIIPAMMSLIKDLNARITELEAK